MNDLLDRLRSFFLPNGGCPYYAGGEPFAEPTLLAALALQAAGAPRDAATPLLSYIQGLQNQDGSISLSASHRDQGLWLTAPAAVVFARYGFQKAMESALAFLIALKSMPLESDPRLKQDNSIPGWPWVPGTFGWVEPTAWSLLALLISGFGSHRRVKDAVSFLLDRQIPSGGWNYGNPGMDDKVLLPFSDTTGVALAALSGMVPVDKVRPSLDLLEKKQEGIVSLCGLAWAVVGLQSFERNTARMKARLRDVMGTMPVEVIHSGHFSIGLIALSGKKVLTP